jgi:pyruvate/2-oxoglutarate/acetoin dehydrogenase E1 component
MKVLHILKTEPEESTKKIIEEHKKDNDVEVIDLGSNKDYDMIVELIEKADKIIVW